MSVSKTTIFQFEKAATEDFSRMFNTLTGVKKIFEELITLNEEMEKIKNSIEFIKQDIRTLENAKNAVLDEEVVTYMENFIEKKKQELAKKEKEKEQNIKRAAEAKNSYREFESYAKIVRGFYDSIEEYLSVELDELTTEEHVAYLFIGILFDSEYVGESASGTCYEEAKTIFYEGMKVKEKLLKTTA